jgi:hypothetical protein
MGTRISFWDKGVLNSYVIFKKQDGRMTMLLSKPVLGEIDISEYVVGEV